MLEYANYRTPAEYVAKIVENAERANNSSMTQFGVQFTKAATHVNTFAELKDTDAHIVGLSMEALSNIYAENADNILDLYDILDDYRSKYNLYNYVQYPIYFENTTMMTADRVFEQYFDLDLIECDENEVFVDCGCYDGETVHSFIRNYGTKYKRIYSYELIKEQYENCKENLKDVPNLVLKNAGVAGEAGRFMTAEFGEGSRVVSQESYEYWLGQGVSREKFNMEELVRIDDDITEPITFLKMDIEGAELPALKGAANHIKNDKPKLAICLYHQPYDLWVIPKYIKALRPDYKLYLRYTPSYTVQFPHEIIVFAV
jgi:FkbM family methyltransferase